LLFRSRTVPSYAARGSSGDDEEAACHRRIIAVELPQQLPPAGFRVESSPSEQQKPAVSSGFLSGAYRDRTGDLRLAKPALSQLS
jgi:hypothetical protein